MKLSLISVTQDSVIADGNLFQASQLPDCVPVRVLFLLTFLRSCLYLLLCISLLDSVF